MQAITIRGGAAARGVGVGDTLADITAAFPKRKIIRATEPIFGFTRVKIPKTAAAGWTSSSAGHRQDQVDPGPPAQDLRLGVR